MNIYFENGKVVISSNKSKISFPETYYKECWVKECQVQKNYSKSLW